MKGVKQADVLKGEISSESGACAGRITDLSKSDG